MTAIDRGRGPLQSLFAFEEDDIERIADRFGDAVWRRRPDGGFGAGSLSYGSNHPVSRMRDAWRRGDLFERAGDETFNLKNAVGPAAENLPTDVARVQTALGRAGQFDLAETDGPTGMFNGLLGERIEKAQRDGGRKVDSTVAPGGETISMLKQLAQNKPPKPSSSPARSAQSSIIQIPRYRRFVISNQKDPKNPNKVAWDEFSNAVINLPGSTRIEQRAYAEVYAAEGGVQPDPTDTKVVAGISPDTLKDLKSAKLISSALAKKRPADLEMPERALIMRRYMDRALNHVGGYKAINRVKDEEVAAAFVDTLYRHGRNRGAAIIQLAILEINPNELGGFQPKLTGHDSAVNETTLKAFEKFANDAKTRGRLLDEIAKFRLRDKPKERDRIEHFIFPQSPFPSDFM